jgi:hypothetical protein
MTFADMLQCSTDGRDATYATIKEAMASGYVTRVQDRDVNGRVGAVVYRLHVTPQNARSEPLPGKPDTVEPDPVRPETSKKTNKPKDLTPNPLISSSEEIISPRARAHTRVGAGARETTPDRDGQLSLDGMPAPVEAVVPIHRKAEEAFARFWAVYPLKKAKGDAWKAWPKAIKAADPDVILAGVARYVAELRATGAYTAYPATWLNGRRWEDEPAKAGNAGRPGSDRRGGGHQPYRDTEDESMFAQALV